MSHASMYKLYGVQHRYMYELVPTILKVEEKEKNPGMLYKHENYNLKL